MSHCINVRSAHVNPTQEHSKSVKVEKIDIAVVYEAYSNATIDATAFKQLCSNAIAGSSGKPDTKRRFQTQILRDRTKAQLLFTTNNYFMAGQGLKV